jgi:hypothetical protein
MSGPNYENLSIIEEPFKVNGEEFFLRELSGEDVGRYRDAVVEAASIPEDKMKERMQGLAEADMLIVSMASFRKTDGKNVTVEEVRKWPHRLLKPLAKRVKKISEMNVEEDSGPSSQSGEQSDTQLGSK